MWQQPRVSSGDKKIRHEHTHAQGHHQDVTPGGPPHSPPCLLRQASESMCAGMQPETAQHPLTCMGLGRNHRVI